MCFPGNEISEVKDGEVIKYPNVLSCGPLVPQGRGGGPWLERIQNITGKVSCGRLPEGNGLMCHILFQQSQLLLLQKRRRTLLPTLKRS